MQQADGCIGGQGANDGRQSNEPQVVLGDKAIVYGQHCDLVGKDGLPAVPLYEITRNDR